MTHPRRAFTLLELIVTIGIIAVLASLIIAALGGVSSAASRAQSTNALREMVLAYNAYSGDHKQRLMPGYLSADRLRQLRIEATLETGKALDNDLGDPHTDASSYVWRLAPYMDHSWKTVLVDYRSNSLQSRFDLELRGAARQPCDATTERVYGAGTAEAAGCNDLGLAARPAFGMNSIYVGGDDVHGGSNVTDYNPWDDPVNAVAATRLSEVRNPARLLVFAPCEAATPIANPPVAKVRFGDAALLPPQIKIVDDSGETLIDQWRVGDNNVIEPLGDFSAGGGWVIARWSKDELPVGHLDGSVQSMQTLDLERDPKNWSPREAGF